jgi:D-lactate dehydrogenase (cytochrome)
MPNVKNASGYYVKENMDLIDLFIGSEGTLGIISEVELRLLKKPAYTWGGMFFFCEEECAVRFVKALREDDIKLSPDCIKIKPAAIEYFNSDALRLLMGQKQKGRAFSNIPDIKKKFGSAIYIEFDGNTEEDIIESMLEASRRAELCGGYEEDTWVAMTPQLMEYMKQVRHAVPEAVNQLVDQRREEAPGITKLGTDMAVPDEKLEAVMDMYKADLAQDGFESLMFGHIGNNHIHVNILPRSLEEYSKGKELYTKWAHKVLEAGGTVSAEHGIGKLKATFLEMMYGHEGINEMRSVRKVFDPEDILSAGNLF